MLHAQPGCPWATATASLGSQHETPRQSKDPALEELVGQPPTEASPGGAELPGTLSVPRGCCSSTFMPHEEGSKAARLGAELQ